MPNGHRKKRGFKGHGGGGGGFVGHDDRVPPAPPAIGLRKVSFKMNRQRGFDAKMRHALMEEDVDMTQPHHYSQHRGGAPRRSPSSYNSRGGRHNNWTKNMRPMSRSPTYWYRIQIKNGYKYDRQHLLKLIGNFIRPVPFDPIGFNTNDEEAWFYVADDKMADALFKASNKITMPDGWKLSLKVRPATVIIEVDDKMTAAIKEGLSHRYNSQLKTLDLSAFHRDNAFAKYNIFCPLNRPNVMTAVINVVGECTPDLVALDLSSNNIMATDHMKIMIEKLPRLKSLHLGKNKLRDIKILNPLKGLPLVELVLDENSLCDRYKDQDVYIRAVRDIFPKVIKLDQADLPPPILFVDEEECSQLPDVKASFMCDANGSATVKQFLELFYQLYDTADRLPLAAAYHESAEFSMCISHDPNPPSYVSESRNLLKWTQPERRLKTLKKGRGAIVGFLNTLPPTTHDPASFAVDLLLYTPQVIEVIVMGLMKERDGSRNPLRSFSRVFVIVPLNGGLCITNEMLSLSPPTPDQVKKAFKGSSIPDSVSSAISGLALSGPSSTAVPPNPDIVTKQNMITTLAAQTNMNLIWSEKCLVETNWDFERAKFAFDSLHKSGAIPAEAFIK